MTLPSFFTSKTISAEQEKKRKTEKNTNILNKNFIKTHFFKLSYLKAPIPRVTFIPVNITIPAEADSINDKAALSGLLKTV